MGAGKKKIYYSMGEVAEMFDVNPSLIRHWESKFDILKPHKNNKGNRLFSPKDVDNLKLIYHLVKEKGMTLAGAQKRIRENPDGVSRDIEVIDRLMGIRSVLLELRQELGMDNGEVYRSDADDDDNTVPEPAKRAGVVPESAFDDISQRSGDCVNVPDAGLLAENELFTEKELFTENESPIGSDFFVEGELFMANEQFGGSGSPDPFGEESPAPQIMEQTLF